MATMAKTASSSNSLRSKEIVAVDRRGQDVADAAEHWFAASAECQREMIEFVSMRLEKDGETAREKMACRNIADVASIQSRWMEETLRDYNSEMSRLMMICAQFTGVGDKIES